MYHVIHMMTQLRNAQMARHPTFQYRFTKHCWQVVRALESLRVLSDPQVLLGKTPRIRMTLKYTAHRGPLVTKVKHIATPGCRPSWTVEDIARESEGAGTAVLLTTQGVLTEREALLARVGGIPLFQIFVTHTG
jgi:small subunit ribosomal protein S8